MPLSARVFELELGAFLRVCEGIDSPRSLACYLLAKAGEWRQYIDLPGPDKDSDSFPDDYLVSSMMLKNPRLPLGVDLEQAALDRFWEAEELCRDTNHRFLLLRNELQKSGWLADDLSLVSRVRDAVWEVLGPLTQRRLDALPARCRFGPGASSQLSGRNVLLSRKYACGTHVTPKLAPLLPCILGPHFAERQLQIVDESNVQFVPKNSKTHRTIAIEPHWNLYVQLGIGEMIRHSLNRLGLCLNDQTRNQNLASRAQYEDLATIDLSMASDTIALRVVEFLLPSDWYELLLMARTPKMKIKGVSHSLEKFSSMGNGFTWELESLIFYCAAAVACGRRVDDIKQIGIYGDDIIIPRQYVPRLQRILTLFGFRMNAEKSFWQGRFFESCGSDYFDGRDVRPVFFKKDKYRDHNEAATHMANAIRLYAHNAGDRFYCDRRLLPAWLYLASKSRKAGRTYLSYGYGDDGLICNWDEARPRKLRSGWDGWRAKVFERKPYASSRTIPDGAYLAALDHGIFGGTIPFGVTVQAYRALTDCMLARAPAESERGRFQRCRLRTVPVHDWYDLGPWL